MERDYIFHEHTTSVCSFCKSKVNAKIIFKENQVYIRKYCSDHKVHDELLEKDLSYFMRKREYDKASTMITYDTPMNKGCPFDCGLCPQHDQHTCIGLIEITTRCNLTCEMCYAKSSEKPDLTLEEIEKMLDYYQEAENNQAEILQISGGEPTLHNNVIEVIKMAKDKKIKYVMLNTNGIRIAEDESFVKELAQFKGGFEIYLQFDGVSSKTTLDHRHKDLNITKIKAIENLIKYKIPVTLVVSVSESNQNEIGEIIKFAIDTPYIRGINFQPIAYYGDHTRPHNRMTLTGVLDAIENQTNKLILKDDFIPLPCNVERIAVTYMLKTKDGFIPALRYTDVKSYLPIIDNTLNFNMEEILNSNRQGIWGCSCFDDIKMLQKWVPKNFLLKPKEEKLKFVDENTFRMTISSFVDQYNFDMKSVQKECVHIITKDLKRIPFSMYNMFYR